MIETDGRTRDPVGIGEGRPDRKAAAPAAEGTGRNTKAKPAPRPETGVKSMRVSALAFAALAAASATVLAISPAAASGANVVSVAYDDLNLDSRAGQRTLDGRIAAAVDQVCGDDSFELRANALQRACKAEAMADALAQRDAAVSGRRGTVRVSMAAN